VSLASTVIKLRAELDKLKAQYIAAQEENERLTRERDRYARLLAGLQATANSDTPPPRKSFARAPKANTAPTRRLL